MMTKNERDALRKDVERRAERTGNTEFAVIMTAAQIIDLLDTCDEFVREVAQQSVLSNQQIEAWHLSQREIELLRAAVRSIGDSVDSFGIDDSGTTAGRALDAIDLALGRPMSAVRIWNGHLGTCKDCNYDRDCIACIVVDEDAKPEPPSAHSCNCPVNGTGQGLRAAADAERTAAVEAKASS